MAILVSSLFLLCREAQTGLRFISLFSFHMLTRASPGTIANAYQKAILIAYAYLHLNHRSSELHRSKG